MKINKILFGFVIGLALAACTEMDQIVPASGTMLKEQVQKTYADYPERAEAPFAGMFTDIGLPAKLYETPDDWEFLMIMFCNDLESGDALIADSGYNWFSVCGEYSSRSATYRNPAIRYRVPYNMIASANTFLASYDEAQMIADDNKDALAKMAQAKALRAYSYMYLAPQYQFAPNTYVDADGDYGKNLPCVPIITNETPDPANNPRATVQEIYNIVVEDLDWAIQYLDGYTRPSKNYIDQHVAYGLRARANLLLGNWQAAYDDAVAAADGYTPASIADVSKPYFYDINSEDNWIWGYDMTTDNALRYRYATTSSWLRSFSAWSYSAACAVYTCINKLLWDLIPATDVRKGWWVDENLESPLLNGLAWPGFPDVANADDGGDSKLPYSAYTNVKFGCFSVGTTSNDEDMPLMRVEEMLLIQAEALANIQGKEADAKEIVTKFVTTYRDPEYVFNAHGFTTLDEIWFQRRVELWGEGFGVLDNLRLNKNIIRFNGDPKSTNFADAFRFNIEAQDPWLRMRFPQGETNTNFGIVDNTGGSTPSIDQNPNLKDGVIAK